MGEGFGAMTWPIFLLVSLAGTFAQSEEKPRFTLFLPPDLYFPSEEKICMHAFGDLKDFSRVDVNLVTSGGPITLYTVLPNMPTWQCQSFQVPEPSKDSEKVSIEVQGISTEGNKVEFGSKSVTLRRKARGTFIQIDKSIYKPGEEIKCRIVTLNQDMEVQNDNYSLIEFQDPQGNRLAQWKDVPSKNGIAEMSYKLADETNTGKYKIKVNSNSVVRDLSVDEYELPKFDVGIESPSTVTVTSEFLAVSVVARYTYGEKVHGNVSLNVCQKKRPSYRFWWSSLEDDTESKDLCHTVAARTDRSGKMKHSLDLGKFNTRSTNYNKELMITAEMEEEGTGVKVRATKTVKLESQLTKLAFKDTKSYFVPGVPYRGKLSLTSFDGQPIASKKVHIKAKYDGQDNQETFVTDSKGEVTFELPTEKWGKKSLSLEATTEDTNEPNSRGKVSITYGRASLYLQDVYMETKSHLYIRPVRSSAPCHQNVPVTVQYSLAEEEDPGCFDLFYLVVLNGKIVQQGQKKVERSKGDALSGSVEFSLPIRDISSSGKILAFMVSESGAIVVDTTTAEVTPCLKHVVNIKFSEDKVLPKSNVKMNLQANGGSICAIRAVDKSVILMKPEDELTESKFQNLVKAQRTYIRSDALDSSKCRTPEIWDGYSDEFFGGIWNPWNSYSYPEKKKDTQNLIHDMGIYVISTMKMNAPITCKTRRIMKKAGASAPDGARLAARKPGESGMPRALPGKSAVIGLIVGKPGESPPGGSPYVMEVFNYDFPEEKSENEEDVGDAPRVDFPETWIWETREIPSSGSSEVPLTVPDTITEWNAQMFCVGSGGLGLSPPTPLVVTKPIFMNLHLPYSVVRGESAVIKASVFNYLSEDLMMKTSLVDSDQHELSGPQEFVSCLGGGQKKTVSWQLTLKALGPVNISVIAEAMEGQCGGQSTKVPTKGKRDAVIQSLLVKPEGTLVEQTHNSMLIVEEGKNVSEKVKLELPESFVEGSEKGFLSLTGDIMGSAMNNLDSLLTMSSGCGEQNMLKYAPNVFILRYLKSSNQLTDSVLEKGKNFLDAGQQRQLMYKHKDGSYSAFGKSDPEGSTWLTAFVVKSYAQAQDISFVDEKHIKEGCSFLEKQQKANGCFKPTGRLLQNSMKGGVDDEVSLTAYVVAALLEVGMELDNPVMTKALRCIKEEPEEKASPYKLALMAYTHTLANCTEERSRVMKLLHESAKKGDGMIYWSQEPKEDKESYWSKPKSVDVEITAYVLLALASHPNPSSKDIGDMVAITRWMCKQQNANGGFSSTQDTIVGLQSLAKFATITSGKSGEVVLDVTSEKGFQHRFLINADNRLLLQKVTLPEVPGEYLVTVSGVGTVFMQILQRYHSPPEVKDPAFGLSIQTECVHNEQLAILLEFWYKGSRPNTNMAIVEVNFPSGYEHVDESVKEVENDEDVKRVEIKDGVMTIYLEEVTAEHQTLEIFLRRSVKVTNLKASYIKIFDYYIPEEQDAVCYLKECE